MKVIFLGSGPFGLPALEVLKRRSARHPFVAAITRPDRPSGRGRKLQPTPVRRRALELGIDCRAPASVNDTAAIEELRALGPDLAIVADYGEILRRPFLELPAIGAFNLHASLLPRWRGAAPVQHALLAGERRTGVTLFRIERGLDSGPIVAQAELEIDAGETAGELEERLARLAAELLDRSLEAFAGGSFTETPQDHGRATLAPKLSKDAGRIDWDREPTALKDFVRALNPWPKAHAFLPRAGDRLERIAILRLDIGRAAAAAAEPGAIVEATKDHFEVACRGGSVRLLELQREGRAPLSAAEFLRGRPLCTGERFTGGGGR